VAKFAKNVDGLKACSVFSLGTFEDAELACRQRSTLSMYLQEQLSTFDHYRIEGFFWTWRMPYAPRKLRGAASQNLKVVLDLHNMPGGSRDGTYRGVWPLLPRFWTACVAAGGKGVMLADIGLWIAEAFVKWVEGLGQEELGALARMAMDPVCGRCSKTSCEPAPGRTRYLDSSLAGLWLAGFMTVSLGASFALSMPQTRAEPPRGASQVQDRCHAPPQCELASCRSALSATRTLPQPLPPPDHGRRCGAAMRGCC